MKGVKIKEKWQIALVNKRLSLFIFDSFLLSEALPNLDGRHWFDLTVRNEDCFELI